ncbi:MAG TPA: hypothetical protein PLP33_24770 [Leptospiraceae bacterium]|nr:hypothetical protein [Leptospiraceae bacterium]
MIDISKIYRYKGIHPHLRGKQGNITEVIDERFVIFSTLLYDEETGNTLVPFRVLFTSLEIVL